MEQPLAMVMKMRNNRVSIYNDALYKIDQSCRLVESIELQDETERQWLCNKVAELSLIIQRAKVKTKLIEAIECQ